MLMDTGSFGIFGKFKQNFKIHIQIFKLNASQNKKTSFSVSSHFKLNASENKNTSL